MSGESAPIPWNFDDKRVGWTLATAYAVVSGAGPSILVLASDPSERADAIRLVEGAAETSWQALPLAVDFLGATVHPADED